MHAMGPKQKTVTIDGVEYEITQLGGLEIRRLGLRVAKLVAAFLAELAKHKTFDEQAALAGIAGVVTALDEETFEALCNAFVKRCAYRVDDRWPKLEADFDVHFSGRPLAISKWFYECMTFNFSDFLDGSSSGGVGEKLRAMLASVTKSKSKSQPSSTGSSGESSSVTA